jgi:predicted permease
MSLWFRLADTIRREHTGRDIDEELQSHLDDAKAHGRDPAESQRAFGSRLRARESVRDAIMMSWLESLGADAMFGWRQLLKRKNASAAAILSLALGIGSCTAAFRLIDALLLRPLPVAEPKSLYVRGYEYRNENGEPGTGYSFDYPGFRRLRAAAKDQRAELMAIASPARNNLTYGTDEEMERVSQQLISGWTFAAFGLKPALGRLFTESDDIAPGQPLVAVLSYDYWSRRFGRNPGVIGKRFREGNDTIEIVGVAPEGFTGTETGTFTDVFIPAMMNARAIDRSEWHWFRAWVQLQPAADRERVLQSLRIRFLANRQEQTKSFPPGVPQREVELYVSARLSLEPAASGVSDMQRVYSRALAILGALVALVLLIACANVANLMTAQGRSRAREMALRVSIGAGRGRLIQLVMIESAWIALIASALGCVFAWRAAPFVVRLINPPDNPVRLTLPVDWRVTGFAVALAFVVAILFGLAPALRASSVKPAGALKGGDGPHSRRRMMNALAVAQVAFCFLVNFVAGLFVSTFDRLANQTTGFSSSRVLLLETVSKTEQPAEYWYQALEHVRFVPGVESASVAHWPLMSGAGWNPTVWANGHTPENTPEYTWFLGVSPGWLETMKIPILAGRDFRPGDSFPEVGIVNETFARRFFDDRKPLGRSFEVQTPSGRKSVRIVGLVLDARYTGMRGSIPATVYVPFRTQERIGNAGRDYATFVVRTKDADPTSLAPLLRREIPSVRPELRVANVRTQEELVRAQTIRERMLALLSLFFAVVALALAAVGLYGVLDYAVVERRRELGIRIALGAQTADIARRVTGEVFSMLLIGSAVGLGLGIASERYLTTLLYHAKGTDLSTLTLPAITIFGAALFAALPPVLRAIRIDPAMLLRAE